MSNAADDIPPHTANEAGGIFHAPVVQAGSINGDVHVHHAAPGAPATPGLIFDLGSVQPPFHSTDQGEVRFTLSNLAKPSIKVTKIVLCVLGRRESDATQVKTPGTPIEETVLAADVRSADSCSILSRHHLLSTDETDGFLLLVTGAEGQVLDLELQVHWHVLGEPGEQVTRSPAITIDFPSHTPAKLLDVLRRRRREGR